MICFDNLYQYTTTHLSSSPGSNSSSNDVVRDAYNFSQGTEVCNEETSAVLSQANGSINKNWILFDSQSTVDMFFNPNMLTNIRQVPYYLKIYYNTGKVKTNMMGYLPGYGPVWYYDDGIANILSLYF